VAPGVPLDKVAVAAEEREVIQEQLMSFAQAMSEKHLLHADLSVLNILWDHGRQQTTVVDFGNAVDLDHVETQKDKINVYNKKNEGFEMDLFLNRRWKEQRERITESQMEGATQMEVCMHSCW